MKRLISFKLMLLVLLAACVTVNVYFPAAAAEQAADRIIDTVTSQPGDHKSKDDSSTTAPAQTPPQSRAIDGGHWRDATRASAEGALLVAAGNLMELIIPSAQAQSSPNLDVSDPQIRAVTASMQQRFSAMKKYFDSGVIGLTADGQVTVRDQGAVPLAERAVVARLVAEDNRDRTTLYAEIARANKHPEWEADIRRTFARRWVERGAQPGWYYQDNGGRWVQK